MKAECLLRKQNLETRMTSAYHPAVRRGFEAGGVHLSSELDIIVFGEFSVCLFEEMAGLGV